MVLGDGDGCCCQFFNLWVSVESKNGLNGQKPSELIL